MQQPPPSPPRSVFWGGYWDSWAPTPAGSGTGAALRTSPNHYGQPCFSLDYPTACPDRFALERNLVGLWANASALLFEGNFNESSVPVAGALDFRFAKNFYWSDLSGASLGTAAVFGGQAGKGRPGTQLTWTEWRRLHGGSQDAGSLLGAHHPFSTQDWATTLNLELPADSPVWAIGWEAIDTQTAGPQGRTTTPLPFSQLRVAGHVHAPHLSQPFA